MKKILALIITILLFSGCSSEPKKKELPSSEILLQELQEKNVNLSEIQVFNEETDPNGNLGRPGNYISKADFADSRLEQVGEYLCGGTIETFSSEDDCQKRYEYLDGFDDPSLGILGLNQYMYKYDKVIFRVSFDLTPEQAEEYKTQMDEIIAQYK